MIKVTIWKHNSLKGCIQKAQTGCSSTELSRCTDWFVSEAGQGWLIPAGSIAPCWDCEGYWSHSQPHPISPSAWVIVTCSDRRYAVAMRPPQIYEGIAMLSFLLNSPLPFSFLPLNGQACQGMERKKMTAIYRPETRTQTQHVSPSALTANPG